MNAKTSNEKYMNIFEHLRELRKRLIISSIGFAIFVIIAFSLHDYIVNLFIQFYSATAVGENSTLYVNSIIEGMATKLKISIIAGLIFSTPLHLYNIIRFVFPALDKKEKRYVTIVLICSFVLIILSIYLSYFKILPLSIDFLTDKSFIPSGVGMLLNYNTNLFYALYFVFWSVIAFQTPILLVLLMALGIIKRKAAFAIRRYVIIIIFVLAAIVTPPDVISQVGLALPLVILYYLAILVAKIFKFGE
jgi:sec-independent protein translocase protein TatC